MSVAHPDTNRLAPGPVPARGGATATKLYPPAPPPPPLASANMHLPVRHIWLGWCADLCACSPRGMRVPCGRSQTCHTYHTRLP
eukprot:2915525-Lingulodinium_polyedra.AAC.2